MAKRQDRIMVVENDPIIIDLIVRQVLVPANYQVTVINSAAEAIAKVKNVAADIIITDLSLPDLSGKDFIVALNSQRVETPVIVIGQRGMEADVIQAFRLGAIDYLIWPLREAEVISAIERVFKRVHEHQELVSMANQLQQANSELQQRVRELTAIFSIGKAVTSITEQSSLFKRIVEEAVKATQADLGWFLVQSEVNKAFILVAQRGFPSTVQSLLNQPSDDGISNLVAMSGEALAIHGEPLKRLRIANLGQSALIVPVKAQTQVIALLVLMRKKAIPFTPNEQDLLSAVADYASISLINARLFRALEERAGAR
jgi:two-component system, NtrC family, sensor kinase